MLLTLTYQLNNARKGGKYSYMLRLEKNYSYYLTLFLRDIYIVGHFSSL